MVAAKDITERLLPRISSIPPSYRTAGYPASSAATGRVDARCHVGAEMTFPANQLQRLRLPSKHQNTR